MDSANASKQLKVSGSAVGRYFSLLVLVVLVTASLCLWDVTWAQALLQPVKVFVTAVHELGHAIACLATGGQVVGMTIVADGQGHGGTTASVGGWPFIYMQTGYLGTAFFGCLLIFLGKFKQAAKPVLCLCGAAIGLASLTFMFGSVWQGKLLQGLGSMTWGVVIGLALLWSGIKLKPGAANFLLIFLAAQTALNSLTDIVILAEASLGMTGPVSFTDATNMEALTGIPAIFWSVLWATISAVMLMLTLWFCYVPRQARTGPGK